MRAIWSVFFVIISVDSLLRFTLMLARVVVKRRDPPRKVEPTGAVVLIAARNESGLIGPTITALLSQLPPASKLWVVADNCLDGTADEARHAGALVAEREGGRVGKGAVIDWWLTCHPEEWASREALIILDADSRLAPGSINSLTAAIARGADAAQAFVAPEASLTPGRLAGYSEVLMQRIDDEARKRCGWPVPLRGTGMAFKPKVLAELAPRLHTFAEDLELDVLLSARRSEVVFVPEAVIHDPKPREARGVSNQRARWLQGQLQVLRDYWSVLLHALGQWRLGTWMLIPLLFLRPKVLFMGIRVIALSVGLMLGAPWWILAVALVFDALYYLGGAAIVDNPGRYLLDLVSAPRYAAIWVWGLVLAAIRRGGWLRAGR